MASFAGKVLYPPQTGVCDLLLGSNPQSRTYQDVIVADLTTDRVPI
jgi:hypothetical protein